MTTLRAQSYLEVPMAILHFSERVGETPAKLSSLPAAEIAALLGGETFGSCNTLGFGP